jgi:hypothetical protein
VVRLKKLPGCARFYLEYDNHEGPHEKSGIGLLIKLVAAVVKKAVIFVLRIC